MSPDGGTDGAILPTPTERLTMYPINLHHSALSADDPSVNLAAAYSRHGFAGAASAPSSHVPFWGRPVDSYEGHAAWRPAVFLSRAAAFLSAERAAPRPAYEECDECGGYGFIPFDEGDGRGEVQHSCYACGETGRVPAGSQDHYASL